MHTRATAFFFCMIVAGLAFAGCDESPLPADFGEELAPTSAVTPSIAFDPTTPGSIEGRVTWDGNPPQVPPFRARVSPLSEQPAGLTLVWPNPHTPLVDPKTKGIAGAVVFLRKVDPERARPWDHEPVRVVVRDRWIHVLQGSCDSSTGFVRRGNALTIVSEDDCFHAVQARGAAFFTLTLPDRDRPYSRVLAATGGVELGSNAGQFWMRGHLFVSDHPYLTRTDPDGHFTLEKVPPCIPSGNYVIGCWLPDWHEASHERDGETAEISRLTFRPAVVKLRDVTVQRGQRQSVQFTYNADDFGP